MKLYRNKSCICVESVENRTSSRFRLGQHMDILNCQNNRESSFSGKITSVEHYLDRKIITIYLIPGQFEKRVIRCAIISDNKSSRPIYLRVYVFERYTVVSFLLRVLIFSLELFIKLNREQFENNFSFITSVLKLLSNPILLHYCFKNISKK